MGIAVELRLSQDVLYLYVRACVLGVTLSDTANLSHYFKYFKLFTLLHMLNFFPTTFILFKRYSSAASLLRFFLFLFLIIYVVQSIISWTGRILALLCTTAETWSHEMVPCPFCSRPSKKQLRSCGVFRVKVTVLKGSCLRAAEIENVAV
jgi:hypothetical protein